MPALGAGKSGDQQRGLVFVEPDDTEVAALSNETAEAILQNNLVIAKLCGGER